VSDVLVIQPDSAQTEALRRIFRRVGAELVLVHSTLEAMDAIAMRMPDLILLSTLLSPRDEDVLMAHLRTLDGASHLQTLTIPQFRSATAPEEPARKSGFSFRKKKPKAAAPVGCDPTVFAEEVVAHLLRANEIRNRPAAPKLVAPAHPYIDVEEAVEIPRAEEPVWSRQVPEAVEIPRAEEPIWSRQVQEPVEIAQIEESVVTPLMAEPVALAPPDPPVFEAPRPVAVSRSAWTPISTEAEDVDRLVRELGLDVRLVEIDEVTPPAAGVAEAEDTYDFAAALDRARIEADSRRSAELARAEADADAIREAAIAEARADAEREAREAVAADFARVQAEAEAMRLAAMAEAEATREIAIAEARAVAEREARQTLDAELARVRSETEVTVADALQKVKLEAEEAERARLDAERMRVEAQQAFAAELARVRSEVEQELAVQLEAARVEAERMRAAEAAAVRGRAAAEAQLKSELDRLRFVAAQTRKADESETRKAAEQIKQLERELATVHAKSEERQVAQLDELRAQMTEMREAAAQHARTAAAEAVASEVARATARSFEGGPQRLNVIRMQPRTPYPTLVADQPSATVAAPAPEAEETSAPQTRSDYLSLWQPSAAVAEPTEDREDDEEDGRIDFRRHAKWALPVAACLLLVTNAGSFSTVARFVGPAPKPPALTVEPVEIEPFIEIVEKRLGSLRVDSTPSGAEAVVDGRSYGKTPVTITDLEIGAHTLVLKSSAGTITRKVTITANETAVVAEAIYAGWLAIFSPIPVTAIVDGEPVNLTDDGRLMTTPGKHVVELISERFNYRATETLEVRPGETTAHTVSLPSGSVRVTAPDGAEIRIDGRPASGGAEGLPLTIGSHEITATHAELGERRVEVDVREGALTEVTLVFE
jgi:hypothetical protein